MGCYVRVSSACRFRTVQFDVQQEQQAVGDADMSTAAEQTPAAGPPTPTLKPSFGPSPKAVIDDGVCGDSQSASPPTHTTAAAGISSNGSFFEHLSKGGTFPTPLLSATVYRYASTRAVVFCLPPLAYWPERVRAWFQACGVTLRRPT